MKFLNYILISVLLFAACSKEKTESRNPDAVVPLSQAQLLSLSQYDGYMTAEIADPWNDGKLLAKLILVPDSVDLPVNLPEGTVVRTPIKRIISGTSPHAALLEELNVTETLVGVCEPEYMNIPFVKNGLRKGSIKNCGSGLYPDMESLLNLRADAIFLSPFENSGGFGKIEKSGVVVIPVADYMEKGPLGRAEWIKFYGRLFGKGTLADSIYLDIETKYNSLKSLASSLPKGKKFLMNKLNNNSWYVPGGKSPVGILLSDANVDYSWNNDNSTGSNPFSFETILSKSGDADVWLFHYFDDDILTYNDILKENKKYGSLKPVKTKSVFADNLKTSGFSEKTPFHPELMLRDIILIGHPGALKGDTEFFKLLTTGR